MRRLIAGLHQLLAELRRRKVYQVAALYCVAAFALLQLADIVLPALGAGSDAMLALLVVIVAGFPAALLLGWLYDWTGSGVRRTPDRAREEGNAPPAAVRWLAGLAAIVATVLLSVGGWAVVYDGDAPLATTSGEIPRLDPRRIAVLYFDDHSPGGDLGYLAAGITESLLHELAGVDGLVVSSRNAVRTFRDSPVPFDSMVAQLGAGSLIEGSVTAVGDRVRATVQVVDGRSGSHIESRIVEGSLDRIFQFQDSLAVTVARSLRHRLGREIRLRGDREGATVAGAWVLYLQGLELVRMLRRLERDDEPDAIDTYARADSLFLAAARLDPDWTAPLRERVITALRTAEILAPHPGALDPASARTALGRADSLLARDPASAQGHYLRGRIHLRLAATPGAGSRDSLLAAAATDLDRAIRAEPDYPEAWWARSEVLIQSGRFDEAMQAAQRAVDLDVFLQIEMSSLHTLFHAALQLGPRDDAIRWCDEGLRRFPREINFLRCRLLILGTFPQVEPDVDEAELLMDSIIRLASPRSAATWRMFAGAHLAQTLARAGLPDSALAVLRAVRGDSGPPMLGSHEAKVYLLLGDRAEAVRLLRRYLAFDPDTAYLAGDWWFEDLREYRPFQEMVGIPADRP